MCVTNANLLALQYMQKQIHSDLISRQNNCASACTTLNIIATFISYCKNTLVLSLKTVVIAY